MNTANPSAPTPDQPFANFSFVMLMKLWFGLQLPVSQLAYATSGFALMIFKYLCEFWFIYGNTGRSYAPYDFLNPLMSVRQKYFAPPAPDWMMWVIIVWSLPFLWIAVSMSVRRAVDAGKNAWFGLWVFVPFANFALMLILSLLPRVQRADQERFRIAKDATDTLIGHGLRSALFGIAIAALICIAMVSFSVYLIADYGAALFMGTPIIMGATSSFLYNRPHLRSWKSSILVAELSILLSGMILLLFAFEGVICLAMLLPIAGGMAILGALIGFMIAAIDPQQSIMILIPISLLPVLAGAESRIRTVPLYEVLTTTEINASPDQVWPHVVGFSDLPPPSNWYFQLGIAFPKRATIQGSGVGAVRYCEFSTGPFVEPITAWEPPTRLAFDVQSQPSPMHELSPYRHVHPPHLDGYLRSKRGEFRLVDLGNGRTRLEGRTWYEYEIFPQFYWTLWTDMLIHRIHQRVLAHIKDLAERDNSR